MTTAPLLLRCLGCHAEVELGRQYRGCPACGDVLVVEYPDPPAAGSLSLAAAVAAVLERVPVTPTALGQGGTPFIAAANGASSDPAYRRLWLKWEASNPTLSQKDRLHGVVSAMAVHLGHVGIITSSTGNNGVAAAAFARRVGLPCIVIPHPEMPDACLNAIAALGGTIVRADGWTTEPELLDLMVAANWAPVTCADPLDTGWANPYIVDGYRSIGAEICGNLQGIPDVVFAPVAGGDTFYGTWRGLVEVARLAGRRPPRMMAVEAAGAAWALEARRAGTSATPPLPDPHTDALSVRVARNGRHALQAINESGGDVVVVEDSEIAGAMSRLASWGLLAEATSSLSVAAVAQARRRGLIDDATLCVAVVTSSIFKWPGNWQFLGVHGHTLSTQGQWDRWMADHQGNRDE